MRLFYAALILAAALPGAAPAQQSWRVIQVPQTQGERDAGGDSAMPGSRAAMLRDLAGVIGAVHYFTVACEGRGSQYWRDRMIAVIEAEGADRHLRAAMIEAFNDQYRERERAFPGCSPDARTARGEAAERGAALSAALGQPYR